MTADSRTDEKWMQRALELAKRGEGLTRPNPPVGALVVKGNRVLGEGYHRKAGGPHAEIHALRQAGERARDGTLYITLEPCSTQGKTPPCTQAILDAGVRRVVVGAIDPNPNHTGRGLRILQRGGLDVVTGIGGEEANNLIAPFSVWIAERRPFVTLKLAMTVDGCIADRDGHSRWISGPAARAHTQALRRMADAVMVGRGTVASDNPSLWPRPARGRHPYRVVVDSRARLPLASQVLNDAHRRHTIVAVTHTAPANKVAALQSKGVQVFRTAARRGRVSMKSLMRRLGKEGVLHVLCEGGGELAEALMRDGLVDRYEIFIAPAILGDTRAVRAISGKGWKLKNMPLLWFQNVERIGPDLLIHAIPK